MITPVTITGKKVGMVGRHSTVECVCDGHRIVDSWHPNEPGSQQEAWKRVKNTCRFIKVHGRPPGNNNDDHRKAWVVEDGKTYLIWNLPLPEWDLAETIDDR